MPELPEVESVRRGLVPHVVGRRIESIVVAHPRAVRYQEEPLAVALEHQTITGVGRRGKFMWLELADQDGAGGAGSRSDSAEVCHIHLGMSGQVRVGQVDSPHVRIQATLSDGTLISFVDQRTFGYWRSGTLADIAHIARDPLDPDFDVVGAARKLRASSRAVKTGLLDQAVVSGIGNIYADEALWAAGIHPRRSSRTLLQREAVALYAAAAAVMEKALEQGGTSFDELYVHVNGESGYFARSLEAYGRTDLPCSRCATPLSKITVGGRGTHFCGECQK